MGLILKAIWSSSHVGFGEAKKNGASEYLLPMRPWDETYTLILEIAFHPTLSSHNAHCAPIGKPKET